MKIRTKINNDKILYSVSKIMIRLLARSFDTILLLGLLIGVYFIITLNKELTFGELVSIEFSVSLVTFFIYFILIPFFTKGFTLFRWIFKIKLIELINRRKYFYHLVIHDLFIWINYMLLILIFSIITATLNKNDQIEFFKSLFVSESNVNYVTIIFKVLFSTCGLISIVFLVYNCINSGKRSIQDLISWTVMISIKNPTPEEPNRNIATSEWKKITINHLPGNINFKK
ncbi:RDD family protein [Mycoplasmoides alvi]|uniref:RDD family protein n=1 Tax=Mycoplasmoides alvi TaxID=78580 RepID=UPI00051ABDE7|nr:RDD family protein [Mycoplasmoides alvi]